MGIAGPDVIIAENGYLYPQSYLNQLKTYFQTDTTTPAPGAAASVQVGTVTTGAAGSQASVTNRGTAQAAILDFQIPQGAAGVGTKGDKGDTGSPGPSVVTTDVEITAVGKGLIVKSPNGTRWRLTPSDAGASVWTQV